MRRTALPPLLTLNLITECLCLLEAQLAVLISVCGRKAFQQVSQLFFSGLLCFKRTSDKQAKNNAVDRFHMGCDLFPAKFRMRHDGVNGGTERIVLFGRRLEDCINIRAVSAGDFAAMGIADKFANDAL